MSDLNTERDPLEMLAAEYMERLRQGQRPDILEKLTAQYPEVPDFPAAEARAHDKLGSFHRQIEDWGKAEREFRQAIALQAPLVKQFPDAPYYWIWMATFRIALADTLLHRDQAQEARTLLEVTISTLFRQLQASPKLTPPHELLSLGYSRLEIALRQTGEPQRAREAAQKAEQERAAARRAAEN